MILKCFVVAIAIKLISCLNLLNELYPKGLRKNHFNSDFNTSVNYIPSFPITDFGTDLDKTNSYVHCFPDVIYPTCILDNQPFYYNSNSYDVVLDPFSEHVKSSHKVNSNGKNNKRINPIKCVDNEKSKHVPVLNCKEENLSIDNKHESDNDLMCQEDNDKTVTEELSVGTENDVFVVDKDEILENSTLASLHLLNETSNIEEYNVHNENSFFDNNFCDTVASIECENITNNISAFYKDKVLNESKEINNDTLESSIKEDYQIQIRVKINIEVLKIFHEKQNDTNKTNTIDEYVPSKENDTFVIMDEYEDNKCSAEEINVLSEHQLTLLHEVIPDNTEFSSLLFELSKENEILYPILQLCNGNILDSIFCNTTDNVDDIETIKTCCKDGHNYNHIDNNNNTTSKIQTKDLEDEKDNNKEEYFLDLIVSLATLCHMNNTSFNNFNESQQNDVLMNFDEYLSTK